MFFHNIFVGRDASERGTKRNQSKGKSRRSRRSAFRSELARALRLEPLEERRLLSSSPITVSTFDLSGVYQDYLNHTGSSGPGTNSLELTNSDLIVVGDAVLIEAVANGDVAAAAGDLAGLGMNVTGTYGNMISGFLPFESLPGVALLGSVRFARAAVSPQVSVGATTSQGDVAMKTDEIRSFLGFDGTGIDIGVLSDSFDTGPGSYAADQVSNDLPGAANTAGHLTPVNVLAEGPAGTDEGRAMLQLIHDVAPGANLLFATAFTGAPAFAANILALQAAGADVIVDDVTYFAQPFFQDGVIAQAADAVGVPLFTSAGNQAADSYESAFVNSAIAGPAVTGGTFHDFDPGAGVDTFQSVNITNGSSFSFQWNESFASVDGGAGNASDMAVCFFNAPNVVNLIGCADGFTTGADAVEFAGITGTANIHIGIVHKSGPMPTAMKYIATRSSTTINEFATNSGTIIGHHNVDGVFSTGAAFYAQTPEYGTTPPVLESFSSRGGVSIRFDTNGNPVGPLDRNKPDAVAPDGTNTTFFGSDAEPDGFPNFFGTSAAAPHAGALAALMLDADGSLTTAQVYSALETTAINMGPAGFDNDTGWGLISGPAAMAAAGGPYAVTFDGTAGSDTMRIVRDGSGNVEFWLGGVLSFEFPATDITGITVSGLAGDDTFTVDFSGGDPIPAGGVSFAGGSNGAGGDTLVVQGGAFTTITSSYDNANDGDLDLDGSVISYTGLEPVLLNVGTANDIIFNLPVIANPDVLLADDTAVNFPGNGLGAANTSAIDGSTFEYTSFTNPASSLTINGSAGFSDVITLAPMDVLFAPGGGDPVLIQSAFNGAGAAADTIDVQAAPVNSHIVLGTAADTVNVSSNAPANTGNLAAIDGIVLINSGNTNASDVLNVSESGVVGAASVTIDLDAKLTANHELTGSGGVGGPWTVRKQGPNNFGGGVNFAGGTGLNQIFVPSVQSSEQLAINAGPGDDTVAIGAGPLNQLQTLDNISASVTVTGGSHATGDILELRDDQDTDGNTYVITTGLVTRNGSAVTFGFNTTENLSIFAGGQPDLFDATPWSGTEMFLHGSNPAYPANPGDRLIYRHDGDKFLSGPGSGKIVATNPVLPPPSDVHYTSIETLETGAGFFFNDVIDLSNPPLSTAGGQDGNPNQVLVQRDATGTYLEISIDYNTDDNGGAPNPILFSRQLFSSVGAITVTGGTDNDQLVVDHANGFINRPITYNADGETGSPGDSLVITGTPAGFNPNARETYIVGADQSSGTWVIDPNASRGPGLAIPGDDDEMTITFTGLEPADTDTAVAIFDVILSQWGDNATIQNGGLLNGVDSLQVVDNSGTFETFRFANKTTARIMGYQRSDAFRVNYTTAARGLTTLELYGHLAAGVPTPPFVADDNSAESFELDAADAITTSLFGQNGVDTFHNNGWPLYGTGPSNMQSLNGIINIDGGAGSDGSYLSDTNDATGRLATLTSTQLTDIAPATINYSNLETFFLEGSAATDTINVLSTQAGTSYYVTGNGAGDTITIGNQTADFNGTFDGTLAGIQGDILLTGEYNPVSPGAVDTINVDASGDAALAASPATIGINPNFVFNNAPFAYAESGPATEMLGFAPAAIRYRHTDTNVLPAQYNNRIENLYVLGSRGNDVISVNATTATVQTTLDVREGSDLVTIAGDSLSANNLFLGEGAGTTSQGNDQFTVNIAAHLGQTAFAPIQSLVLEGNGNLAANTNNRDRLTINDNNAGFARNLNYDYLNTAGDLDILANAANSGLAGANNATMAVNVRTMETLVFNGGGNNDLVRVTGTDADDDMTVALLPTGAVPGPIAPNPDSARQTSAGNSALVFLNGNPYTESPGVASPGDSLAGNLPGLAGVAGRTGPDMLINGIALPAGITLDGSGVTAGGIGNRAIVQAASEARVAVPGGTNDVFGFGVGTLIPGFGAGNGFDNIRVNDGVSGPNRVAVLNTSGVGGFLVSVTVVPSSFVQSAPTPPRPGLIVNAGDEAGVRTTGPQAGLVADDIFVTAHSMFNIQVNGNLPPLNFDINGMPIGDQLNVASTSSFSLWSDKETPPNVSVVAGNDPYGVKFSSIERTLLVPGNGVINLIGDQNNPQIDQTDWFRVVGRNIDFPSDTDAGYQEGFLVLNGSAPIMFDSVQFLNSYGFDLQGQNLINPPLAAPDNPATQSLAANIDTLEVTPYADNTPRGWGVHLNWNEGVPNAADPTPDGDPVDLLIYHTSLYGGAVSEGIVIQPSAVDGGQLFSNNTATGTPIVVIDYMANTDIRVHDDDGFVADTDTLTLRGTNPDPAGTPGAPSGREEVSADFNAAGNAADPMVTVRDQATGTYLYRVQTFTGFNTINFDLLAGDDAIGISGRNDGSLTINIDGGDPVDSDWIGLDMTTGADTYAISPGPQPNSQLILARLSTATQAPETVINAVDFEQVLVASLGINAASGDGGADRLTFNGTGNADTMTLVALPDEVHADGGTVRVNDGPQITFDDLGDRSSISLNGLQGDDVIQATQATNWLISAVNIDGGLPSASDRFTLVGTSSNDAISFTATGENTGTIAITSPATGGTTTTYGLTDVESAAIDAQGQSSVDTVTSTLAQSWIVPDPFVAGRGTIMSTDIGGNPLLPLAYDDVENPVVSGTTVVIQGSEADDWITVGYEDLAGDGSANQIVVRVSNVPGVPGNPTDVTGYADVVLQGLGGDDRFTVDPEVWNQGGMRVTVLGGDPGDSDVLLMDHSQHVALTRSYSVSYAAGAADDAGTVAEAGNQFLNFSGVELLQLLGNGRSDVLELNDDLSDNTWQIAPGPAIQLAATRSAIDGRTPIDFEGFAEATFVNRGGVDRFEVAPKRLTGSVIYEVIGLDTSPNAPVDTLVILGSAEGDDDQVTNRPIIVTDQKVELGVPVLYSGFGTLEIQGLDGDDVLQVDASGGPVRTPVLFDGGAGSDTLQVIGAPAPSPFAEVIYSVGPAVTEGRLSYEDANNNVLMKIDFINLEPVQDNVPAAVLTVVGTGADNAIDYVAGPNSGNAASIFTGQSTGLVRVDAFETIEFARKGSLVINAGSGDDVIHLNNPVTPFSLTGIAVLGGDPTASDSLIVNGLAATVGVNVTSQTITGASGALGAVPISYAAIEHLTVVAGTSTTLTVSGSSSSEGVDYTLTPGATDDRGDIETIGVPISFVGFGPGSTLNFVGDALDGTDELTILGTSQNDSLNVAGTTGTVSFAGRATVTQTDIDELVIDGLDGDDQFTIDGDHPYVGVAIHGNNPDASDVLNFLSSGGNVTVDFGAGTVTEALFGPVSFSGLETLNVNVGGADLFVLGTVNDDQFSVTPDVTAATTRLVFNHTTVNASSIDQFTVNGVSGDDALTVTATSTGNTIAVTGTYVHNTVPARQRIDYANMDALRVIGSTGSDTFNVTPSAATEMFLDGGDPVGILGDRISLTAAAATTFVAGPEGDEGGFRVAGYQAVSYDHIEAVDLNLAGNAFMVQGTNGADQIKVLGTGTNSYELSVNGGPAIVVSNSGGLTVDAKNGDDDIDIDVRALALSSLTVIGNNPSIDGDTLAVQGVAGTNNDNVSWTPTAFDAGSLVVGAQTITVQTIERLLYDGENGNESVTVHGSGWFIHTPGAARDAGTVQLRSGLASDPNSRLAISYEHLGSNGSVTLDGTSLNDTLVARGTDSNDAFSVAATGDVGLRSLYGDHVTLIHDGLEALVLDGLDGDDTFTIQAPQPYSSIAVWGGNPSAGSDAAILNGTAAGDAIALTQAATGDLVTGLGGTITLVNVEDLTVNGLGGNDTLSATQFGGSTGLQSVVFNGGGQSGDTFSLTGTGNQDDIQVTPQSTTSVTARANGLNPLLTVNLASDLTSTFTVSGGGNADAVTVHGSAAANTISVVRGSTTTVAVDSNKRIDVAAAAETLTVAAGLGADTINVTGAQSSGVALTVDGGQPSGLPGAAVVDSMNVANSTAGTTVYSPGATDDSGTLTTPDGAIPFYGLEVANVTSFQASDIITAHGTNGPDQIALLNNGANRIWVNNQTVIGFTAFGTVNLQGRFGEDLFTVTPVGLAGVTAVNVDGGDPTASDHLVVTASAAQETIAYAPTSADAGSVTVSGSPVVNFTTTESVAIDGRGGNDNLSYVAPTDNVNVVYSALRFLPGAYWDSARVEAEMRTAVPNTVVGLPPLSYEGLGAGTLRFTNVAATRSDVLEFHGTDLDDEISVYADGEVYLSEPFGGIPRAVRVQTPGIGALSLEALEGDDRIYIQGTDGANVLPFVGGVAVHGGGPDDGDMLALYSAVSLVSVDLATSWVLGYGSAIRYSGLETLDAHVTGENLLVFASDADDTVEVTPLTATSGVLQANDADPVFKYSGLDAVNGTFTVNLLSGGEDRLVVFGNSTGETIDVTPTTVRASGQTITYANAEALTVDGQGGSDTFNVTPAASTEILILGGDPIATLPGDVLNLVAGAAPVVFTAGPEGDEGGLQVWGTLPVSYDEIESISVDGDGTGDVTVNATNADNDITVVGTGGDDFTVSIDGSPAVQFTDFAAATINGLAGDDDIDIDLNGLAGTALTVNGNDPSAGGADTVTITGSGAADAAVFTPTGVDSGTFDTTGLVTPIALNGIEALIYDGEAAGETLTVRGQADGDVIVHTPGTAVDAGLVQVDSLLAVEYLNLGASGSVTLDGQVGTDTVVARGTSGDDEFDVAAGTGTVLVTTVHGSHVPLVRTDAADELLVLDGLDGDDAFEFNLPQPYRTATALGGSPGSSDVLTINDEAGVADVLEVNTGFAPGEGSVEVNGGPQTLDYVGVEHVVLLASEDVGDSLEIEDDLAGNLWEVFSGPIFGDRVQIDNRETYDYAGFDSVELDNDFGSDVFRIYPTDLDGFLSLFMVDADGDDKLELVGTNNADSMLHTAAAQYTVNAVPIDFGGISTLQLTGLDGADTMTADLSILAGGVVTLQVDGGEPSASGGVTADALNLTVLSSARITQSGDYSSGMVDQAGAVTVNYTALEGLNIQSKTAASTLTIRGTNDGDQIAISPVAGNNNQGRVWINDGPVMTFNTATDSNFGTALLQGRFGDDHFSITPIVSVGVTVDGNDPTASDTAVINAVANTRFAPTSSSSAVVTVAGFASVTLQTMEGLTLGGNDGNLVLTIAPPAGAYTSRLTPGATPDSGAVQVGSLLPLEFTNLGLGGSLVLDDADAAQDDTFIYLGTSVDDVFSVNVAGQVNLNSQILVDPSDALNLSLKALEGDDVFNVVGGLAYGMLYVEGDGPAASDTLNLDAPLAAVTVDLEARTVVGFVGTVQYSGIETIDVDAGGMTPTVRSTAVDDDITVTVYDADSGKVESGLAVQQNGQAQSDIVAPVVYYWNTNGAAVNVDLDAGQDTLVVVGNALSQTFDINIPAGSVRVNDLNDATNDGIVTFAGNESLEVFGLEGDDTFNVVAGAIPLFVDGGDPIGQTAGDKFNMLTGGGAVIFESGPEPDEGGIRVGANARVSYDHIEAGQVTDFDCAVIMGTNGDDDITIIARTELSSPTRYASADGNKDFTSTVNDGIEILWVNNVAGDATVNLYVDAMAGDDDVVFRAPALDPVSGAPIAWNVHAWVVGGTPSAVTGDQGDVFELETPGPTSVRYQPLTSETGTLSVNTTASTGAPYDTMIHLVQNFVVACTVGGGNEYASSEGGFEALVYDGETADDSLTVLDTAGDDTIFHTPGAGRDEGLVRVNELLAMQYQNLGLGATLTLGAVAQGGADTLVALGTATSDQFTVDRVSAAIGRVSLNSQLPLLTDGLESYTLEGLDGDDRFALLVPSATAVTTINVHGAGPGASDVLEIIGQAGVVDTIEVQPDATRTNGVVNVNAVAVNYSGTEHLQLTGGGDVGDALTIRATSALGDNLWTVNAGDFGDRVQIDGRETIDFWEFDGVQLINQYGTDSFQVYPTSLGGYRSLTVIGGGTFADDILEIIGTPANDVVTSTANTVTVNTRPVTAGANLIEITVATLAGDDSVDLDLNLAGYRKVVNAGDGNDTVDVSGMQDATIYGGAGDDSITGSPLADLIYGGSGNDAILGLGGNDTVYGDEGDDTFTGGTDNDNLFGGDGSDRFVWNNGDNSDVVEGDEGVDVQVVNGAAAGDSFVLRTKTGDQTRAFFERTNLVPFTVDMGKVEQVDINGLGGSDAVVVQDLFTTDVRQVNVDVGVQTETDAVVVHGRTVADGVALTALAGGVVNIAGLAYDVNVSNLDSLTDADTLTFNANAGDDLVFASDGLSAIFGTTLANVNHLVINGGQGNDSITGFGQLNGNEGDDMLSGGDYAQSINGGAGRDQLYGGGGDDVLNGGAGEDLFVGGAGSDTIDGGDTPGNIEWDTILVSGTSGNDTIEINQTLPSSLTHRVNADTQTDTLGLLGDGTRTVDEVRVEAGSGADLIRVRIADAAVNSMATDGVYNALVAVIHGGSATEAGDRLVLVDDGADDLTIYRKSQDDAAGTASIGPANAEAFENVFDGIERVQFVDETGAAVNANPGDKSRLVVFKHDPYEYNDDRFVATHLGADGAINVDPTIDPGALLNPFGDNQNLAGDADWYRFEAQVTGTLDLQVFFEEIGQIGPIGGPFRPGLPGNGNLDIELYDVDGTLIAGNGPNFGRNDGPAELNVDGDSFAENERIRIPAVQGQVYYLRVFGVQNAINNYGITVLNAAPPTPFDLELDDNPANGQTNPPGTQTDTSDTGRSQFDNHTYDNTPTLYFRLDDGIFLHDLPGNPVDDTPPDEVIPIPFRPGVAPNLTQPTQAGYAIGIFDEGNTGTQTGTAPQTPLGFATATVQEGVYTFTVPNGVALSEGSHFLTARVLMIDPATPQQTGWGPRSVSLEIVVDRTAPPAFFGLASLADTTQGLAAASDSGVTSYPATNVDRVTNDTTPTFFGTAEADSVVRLYVETNGVAGLQSRESGAATPDLFVGLTVAVPLDGTNQFPGGQWEIESMLDLNSPLLGFAEDGVRKLYVTGEDLAGNITADGSADVLNIFLDTAGPQVTRVDINARNNADYNIWDHKGTPDGANTGYLKPTPLVNSLVVSVQDLPARSNVDPNFLYPALFTPVSIDPGHYQLVGDANGVIPIQSISFTSDALANGTVATGYVTIGLFEPLPDDRYTLTIADDLTDVAGNALDGESNTVEPHDSQGTLPSGDGVPGGDFAARFTVDSRSELAVNHSGSVWVDTNGNFTFDPDNADFVNRDITYVLGYTTDNLFAGNFSGPGPDGLYGTTDDHLAPAGNAIADGFDKLAAYGKVGVNFRWLIDITNDGVPDPVTGFVEPKGSTAMPFAGNFDGSELNGDEVGFFTGHEWWVDTNHDYKVDTKLASPLTGIPVCGDFDGDGKDDLATWKDDAFTFDLAANGWGQTDATIQLGFIGLREKPVAADMDMDGIDDIGLWAPDRAGVAPVENGEWYILVSNAFGQDKAAHYGTVKFLNHPFTPIPFAKDIYASFGDEFAVPVVGNFDPPAMPAGSGTPIGLTNLDNPYDVNVDGVVNALDALILINDINNNGARPLPFSTLQSPFLDVTKDGSVSAADVLGVINAVNTALAGSAGGEGEGVTFPADEMPAAAPAVTLAAEPLGGIQHAGLLVDPVAVPEVAAAPSAAAKVDEYFAREVESEDELSVYSADLAEAVVAASGSRVGSADRSNLEQTSLDGVLADQNQPGETMSDRFFAQLGRFFGRRA